MGVKSAANHQLAFLFGDGECVMFYLVWSCKHDPGLIIPLFSSARASVMVIIEFWKIRLDFTVESNINRNWITETLD